MIQPYNNLVHKLSIENFMGLNCASTNDKGVVIKSSLARYKTC